MAEDVEDLSDLLGPEPTETPAPANARMFPRGLNAGGRLRLRAGPSLVGIKPSKHSHTRMLACISAAMQMPVAVDVCMRCSISPTTMQYWLKGSIDGKPGDKYDVYVTGDPDDKPVRFHEAMTDAYKTGVQLVEVAAFNLALGQAEVLTFQGRVVYQHDPELVGLFGYACEQTYLADPVTGAPVPETILKQDPDMLRFILKARNPEVYGNKTQIDLNVRGGVLAVPAALSIEDKSKLMEDFRADAVDVEFEEVDDSE